MLHHISKNCSLTVQLWQQYIHLQTSVTLRDKHSLTERDCRMWRTVWKIFSLISIRCWTVTVCKPLHFLATAIVWAYDCKFYIHVSMHHNCMLIKSNKMHQYAGIYLVVVAQTVWPVPEGAVTVLCSPDDGCNGHPKHVESDFAVNKYLHTVAACWILLIYDCKFHKS